MFNVTTLVMDEKKIVLILNLKLHNFMTNFIDQFCSVDVETLHGAYA